MYRIRQQDGRELEFPSIQSFSDAVREGLVAAEDEIFHRRAERWLPVREHPHFQKALAETDPEGAATAPAPPPPRPSPPQLADVNLDAILALLDSPVGPAPSPPPAAPDPLPVEQQAEEPPEVREPADPETALGNIDDLPVLRASFEEEEEEDGAVVEPSTPPDVRDEEAVASAEPGDEVPIESLAPEGPESPEAEGWVPGADDEGWQPGDPTGSEQGTPPGATGEPQQLAADNDDEDEDAEEFTEEELFPSLETGAPAGSAGSPSPALPWEASVTEPEPLRPEPLEQIQKEPAFTGPEMDLGSPMPEPVAARGPEAATPQPERVLAPVQHEADGAAAAGLDWAGTVSGTFPVGGGRNRLPLVAAAVVLVTLVAWFLLRGGDGGEVASEGLPAVGTSSAAAETVPQAAGQRPTSGSTGEALVLQPDVPTGSAVAITPADPIAPPTTAREQVVPLDRPIVRAGDGTGGVQLGRVDVGTFSGMKSHGDLMRFYNASYDQAQARLEADLVRAGFSRLFGGGTLTTSEGLRDGRRALVTGRAALAAYREREGAIEAAYTDSLAAMGRRLGLSPEVLAAWAPRPSRREPERAAAPIGPLLDQADDALEFLQGEIGHYRLQGTTLIFEREAAAQQFSQYRVSLERGVAALEQGLITQRAAARALGSPGLPLEMTN